MDITGNILYYEKKEEEARKELVALLDKYRKRAMLGGGIELDEIADKVAEAKQNLEKYSNGITYWQDMQNCYL